MISRKEFIYNTALSVLPISVLSASLVAKWSNPNQVESDENYWEYIRTQYSLSSEIIYLNSGAVSPQPISVQKVHDQNLRVSNQGPSYYMWRILDQKRESLRERLAQISGCNIEELALVRNTTEGLDTVIAGLPLQAGDEVVLSVYDYPNMINAWKQRERRDGIKLVWVKLDLPEEKGDEIINKYATAITDKTKLVHITHVINWTGQVLPVKKIAEIAHAKGSEVMVDAAHSFAHIEFAIPDTGADYLSTSLHKWLCAPFGTGALFIRKEKIAKIWPAFSSPEPLSDNIRKFESLGTRSFAAEMAIAEAINFHEAIGIKRKEHRVRFLKNYWYSKIAKFDKIKLYTPFNEQLNCGLATFGVEGKDANEIDRFLFEKYKIHGSIVKREQLNALRITPNVFTSLKELDLLVEGIKTFINT